MVTLPFKFSMANMAKFHQKVSIPNQKKVRIRRYDHVSENK